MSNQLLSSLEHTIRERLVTSKSPGLMLSGGIDSAILLWVICKVRKENLITTPLKIITVPRSDDAYNHASRIVSWINFEYNIDLPIHRLGDITLEDGYEQVKSGGVLAFNTSLVDLLFTASTAIPAHMHEGSPRRDEETPRVCKPMLKWTKDMSIKLALHLNLTNAMTLSHSCTELVIGRCNRCWQCRERQWAFATNGRNDPGRL